MTWVLQSKGVPKELCDKVSLMLVKPRHVIHWTVLINKKRRLLSLAQANRREVLRLDSATDIRETIRKIFEEEGLSYSPFLLPLNVLSYSPLNLVQKVLEANCGYPSHGIYPVKVVSMVLAEKALERVQSNTRADKYLLTYVNLCIILKEKIRMILKSHCRLGWGKRIYPRCLEIAGYYHPSENPKRSRRLYYYYFS
tara:strand:- start:1256 stop:1846 length:591 start_codon:yes stop_codon:yes gene_type:complete